MKTKSQKILNVLSATVVINFMDEGGTIISTKTVEIPIPAKIVDRLAKLDTSVMIIEDRYELHTATIRNENMEIVGHYNPN